MANVPQVGSPAPDFTLEGTEGTFTLSEHRGERVVLLFYPGDRTMVCTKQFCSYRDSSAEIDALGATLVGISQKGVDSKLDFQQKNGLTTPLLADEDGAVSARYGVKGKLPPMTKRATFVVDEEGIIRYAKVHPLGLHYESAEDLKEALASVPAAT